MEQSTTADASTKKCWRCGREFVSFGPETSCNRIDCDASILSVGEPWVVKKPIKVKITQLTTGLPIYLK